MPRDRESSFEESAIAQVWLLQLLWILHVTVRSHTLAAEFPVRTVDDLLVRQPESRIGRRATIRWCIRQRVDQRMSLHDRGPADTVDQSEVGPLKLHPALAVLAGDPAVRISMATIVHMLQLMDRIPWQISRTRRYCSPAASATFFSPE